MVSFVLIPVIGEMFYFAYHEIPYSEVISMVFGEYEKIHVHFLREYPVPFM